MLLLGVCGLEILGLLVLRGNAWKSRLRSILRALRGKSLLAARGALLQPPLGSPAVLNPGMPGLIWGSSPLKDSPISGL